MNQNLCISGWRTLIFSIMALTSSSLIAWTTPEAISTAGLVDNPVSAIDASGNGIVVFLRGTSPEITVQAVTYISGIWSAPIDLTDPGNYGFPTVQVDSSGNAMVAWEHYTSGLHEIQVIDIPFNSSPGTVLTISFINDNRTPSIILDNSGNGFAIWNDRTNDQIVAAQFHNYNLWTAPVVVSQTGGLFIPDGVMNPTGNAISYWFCTGSCTGRSATFTSGSWVVDGAKDTVTHPIWDQIVIDINGSGTALAVWVEHDEGRVMSAYKPINGTWSTAVEISDDILNSFHSVEINDSGNAVAAWINNDLNIVQAASCVNGIWEAPVIISTETGVQTAYVNVDNIGNATVIYQNLNGGIIDIVTLPFSGSWSSPMQISGETGYNFSPYLSGNATGNLIAVWVNSDGTDNVIQASVN